MKTAAFEADIRQVGQLPCLYKLSKTGAAQSWQIFVHGNTFWTEAGQIGGVITKSEPTTCEGKNIGRANETSGFAQALAEASAKHKKKLEHGYNLTMETIGDGLSYYEPMLAHKFVDYKEDLKYPVLCQRKSDGIRAIITKDGATTRKGKPHKCVPHILKALKPFFDKDPDAILDGELYNHELHDDFNKISSFFNFKISIRKSFF